MFERAPTSPWNTGFIPARDTDRDWRYQMVWLIPGLLPNPGSHRKTAHESQGTFPEECCHLRLPRRWEGLPAIP